LARPNYQHGKRLRELAKKQKREAKMQRRLERKQAGLPPEGDLEASDGTPEDAEASEDGVAEDSESREPGDVVADPAGGPAPGA
jgi:hypothetical protein